MLKKLKLPLMEDGSLKVDNGCEMKNLSKRWYLDSQKGSITFLEDGGLFVKGEGSIYSQRGRGMDGQGARRDGGSWRAKMSYREAQSMC